MTTRRRNGTPIEANRPAFRRSLRARRLSERTIFIYDDAARRLDAFLESKPLASIERDDIEHFMKSRLRDVQPSTANQDYRSLQAFFKWAEEEDILPINPISRMQAPRVPPRRTPVLTVEELQALLNTTDGRGFAEVRDKAMLGLFIDTGCRLSEIANLKTADLDIDNNGMLVTGKGNRTRHVAYGDKTANALDRYLRKRNEHPKWDDPTFWLGKRGRMTPSGLAQAIAERSAQAGLGRINPHRFRHTWTHMMMSSGMTDTNLQTLGGWDSPQMLQIYGATMREQRAVQAYRNLSPVDRLTRR